jgi:two-component system, chemotaxis family, protein-glutamate methylesterase/glutaminase
MHPADERRIDIIVIGASAGGVQALQQIAAGLDSDIAAAVFIVLHVWRHAESYLPYLLSRAGKLPAQHATNFSPIECGRIYVAPPDHHLVLEPGHMKVVRGPKENLHRPSVDVLFRSAARAYGPRVAGVLLTGHGDDGAAGLAAIRSHGGITIVQDPKESEAPSMPLSAIRTLKPDHELQLSVIPHLLNQTCSRNGLAESIACGPVTEPSSLEHLDEENMNEESTSPDPESEPASGFICPDCGGALWEREENGAVQFRCRIGHAYSPESMMVAENEAVENALWSAVRSLEESASLARRLAKSTPMLSENLDQKAERREQDAQIIRNLLIRQPVE